MGVITRNPKVGEEFGKLIVSSEPYNAPDKNNRSRRYIWVKCKCDEWHLFRLLVDSLYSLKGARSCGCLRKTIKIKKKKIAKSSHPLYSTWTKMIDRCYNPKNRMYHRYGGRGIKICDRWRNSF